jgi:coenzyme F420-0:L-glutamate ligase / coenzyme F420-1:gamma-L-glutamate ligase
MAATTARMALTALGDIPLIQAGDDLAELILHSLAAAEISLEDGDVLVLAQKIVSKAEGCEVRLSDVQPSARAEELAAETSKDPRFVEVVLQDSREVLRARPGTIIVEHRLGFVCANAGVDRSNVAQPGDDERLLRLPLDPDGTCADLRERLHAATGAHVGVIINDSHGRAWRTGTVGVALGAAGVPALLDLRGHPDLFDYALQVTQVGLADELAAAASLLMGQADEGRPVIHIRGCPYTLREGTAQELIRPKEMDLFR